MNRLTSRKTFRVDKSTALLLSEVARHSYRCESELMRRYVAEGVRREAAIYADETQAISSTIETLRSVR